MLSKTVYIIVGPTAVGKTSLAIQLAKHLQTEIISADARQCYRELDIGVARPSQEELNQVPHHFIANHSIHEIVNASVFEKETLVITEKLFQQKDNIVMVGGTGLYIKAFCEGLDDIPSIDPSVRSSIIESYESYGLIWLQNELAQKDPLYWKQAEQENPHRLMRALEVYEGLGKSILTYLCHQKKQRPFEIKLIGLEMERSLLYNRINSRVEQMMALGLEKEVRRLLPQFSLNALQTVGYREWLPYFNQEQTKAQVIAAIQQNTRQYAKRQMTWFKKDPSVQWFNASAPDLLNTIIASL
ncbi:MAG: tRNA (adenosine(37)-N6)-dimethylallyltransferase MiaA [Sediminibacterium sp.]|jgi:tRNA dimethylallyltransferase|nr:tRNA (adenosine(37)-N6)-dimethylallyltransferase MiaA [Sediminibacterium sp.]